MRFLILLSLVFLIIYCTQDNPLEEAQNRPPEIETMLALPDSAGFNEKIMIFCCAVDPDQETLSYKWDSEAGTFLGGDSVITWNAPEYECQPWIICTVTDPQGALDKDSIMVFVVDTSH